MTEFYVTNENNERFVIINNNSNYTVYKIIYDKRQLATREEAAFALQKFNNNLKSYKEIVESMKEKIKSGEIIDYYSLKEFIDSTNLNEEEKKILLQDGIGELQIIDIIALKDKIINQLRNHKKKDVKAIIEFQVHDNSFGEKYCEIKLNFADDFSKVEYIKETVNYNKTLQRELIEPVMLELALNSQVVSKNSIRTSNLVDNKGDFYVNTANKSNFVLKNGDYDYIEKLSEKLEVVKEKPNVYDSEQRSDIVNDIQGENKETNGKVSTENNEIFYNDMGEVIAYVKDGKLIPNNPESLTENNNITLTKENVRVRKKDGYSNVIIIFAIISLISSLLIILQIFLLNR